jgi:DNA replication protein DnaD
MNRVLLNWHEKGLHSLQQVTSEHKKQPQPEVSGFTPGAGEIAAVSNLQKFRDSLKE